MRNEIADERVVKLLDQAEELLLEVGPGRLDLSAEAAGGAGGAAGVAARSLGHARDDAGSRGLPARHCST